MELFTLRLPSFRGEPARRLGPEEQTYWIALRLTPNLGPRRAIQLLNFFKSPRAVFEASRSELMAAGAQASAASSIASGCMFEDALVQQQKMDALGVELLTLHDPAYPQTLRDIVDPPLLLFCRGNTELLSRVSVAIIGTRRPSAYGLAVAERFGAEIAAAGVVVVSGLARGIDTAAHRAALSVNGLTAGVLGCGVDLVYPSENAKIYEQMTAKGLILSEFPMGAPAYPQNFPIRNRIVSGVSSGVVVVEGAQYSGSAITAKIAFDQGREVFAVPGNITSKTSWGPNLLLRQGAKLVLESGDILNDLPMEAKERIMPYAEAPPALPEGPTGPVCRSLLSQIQVDTPVHIDELLQSVEHYSSSEIVAALFEMELLGLVKQLPGRQYVRIW